MNRCTYVLAGNAANRVPPPSTNPPASVSAQLKDLYISQEKERHRLLMQVSYFFSKVSLNNRIKTITTKSISLAEA